jgi:hypothetical protein
MNDNIHLKVDQILSAIEIMANEIVYGKISLNVFINPMRCRKLSKTC